MSLHGAQGVAILDASEPEDCALIREASTQEHLPRREAKPQMTKEFLPLVLRLLRKLSLHQLKLTVVKGNNPTSM